MTQLALFGEVVNQNSKKEKKAPQKKIEGKKKTVPVPKDKKLPSNKTLLVCYAREQFEYSLEERAELQQQAKTQEVDELEIVRRELARYYPELSAERVTWHWEVDEEKEIDSEKTEEDNAHKEATQKAETTEEKQEEQSTKNNEASDYIVVVPVVTAGKKGSLC